MGRVSLRGCGLALFLWLLAPAGALAQSAISGLVRDTSGAVMPGVTVEAASPVLIEKVRSVVTDDQGRYTIIDLRPGTYTVTFTLPGFNTYRQEGLELPANFTATVNADMRVGALEESVTVTGAAPVVDVQNTQRQVVLNRDLMDAVPSCAQLLRSGRVDAGRPHEQHGRRRQPADGTDLHDRQRLAPDRHHGAGRRHELNSLMNDGQVQAYFSDAAKAEVTYQTSGVTADVSTGGVRINMIPKDGGNIFCGQAFVGGTDGEWQSDNVTDDLRARGLGRGSRVAKIQRLQLRPRRPDYAGQAVVLRQLAADCHRFGHSRQLLQGWQRRDRTGIEDQWIQNQMVRLTWQINQKNKFSVYHDRYPKFKGHEGSPATSPSGTPPPAGAIRNTRSITPARPSGPRRSPTGCCSRPAIRPTSSTSTSATSPACRRSATPPAWFTTIGKEDIINAAGLRRPHHASQRHRPEGQHHHRHAVVRHRQPRA